MSPNHCRTNLCSELLPVKLCAPLHAAFHSLVTTSALSSLVQYTQAVVRVSQIAQERRFGAPYARHVSCIIWRSVSCSYIDCSFHIVYSVHMSQCVAFDYFNVDREKQSVSKVTLPGTSSFGTPRQSRGPHFKRVP